jgi:hypothetical protein
MTDTIPQVIPQSTPSISVSKPISDTRSSSSIKKANLRTNPWVISFFCWGIGVVLLFVFMSNTTWFAWRQLVARYILQSEYVTLTSRTFDRHQYIVHSTKLKKPGYLVLFLGGQYDIGMKTPIAHTELLPPGVYTNIQIHTDADRLLSENPLEYQSGESLYVGLFYDDGDSQFNSIAPDAPKDAMAMDSFGQPVFAKLTIQ